jgi:hypothetical protein
MRTLRGGVSDSGRAENTKAGLYLLPGNISTRLATSKAVAGSKAAR